MQASMSHMHIHISYETLGVSTGRLLMLGEQSTTGEGPCSYEAQASQVPFIINDSLAMLLPVSFPWVTAAFFEPS